MFGFLKKKISGFVDKITGGKTPDNEKIPNEDAKKDVDEYANESTNENIKNDSVVAKSKTELKPEQEYESKSELKSKTIPKSEFKQKPKLETEPKSKPEPKQKPESRDEPKNQTKKKNLAKLGIKDHIVGLFGGDIELKESHLSEALDELEIGLIESDVSLDISEEIKDELYKDLIGKKIKKSQINNVIQMAIKNAIASRMNDKPQDILTKIQSSNKRPFVILFLGPNGAGKTTTIAKIAKHLTDNKLSVVLASADTFRAAAIEQLDIHAVRLGIKNIKRPYGSDPSAVAYDAIQHATSKSIDVVLIDTAGRQNTDYNLIQELKKIVRVSKPDLKIYVSESIGGNAAVDQIQEFHNEIGLDGIILTKLDLDPKGGVVISMYATTNVPIMYLGVGQGYDDLVLFDKDWILKNIGV